MYQALLWLSVGVLLSACTTPVFSKNPMPNTTTHQVSTVSFDSSHDFVATQDKIITTLTQKNMTIFAKIDHQEAAIKSGLTMQPATVIIFGTPKVGTPYMIKDPRFALELPLKVLITQTDGKVQVVMKDTKALVAGTDISHEEVKDTLGKAQLLIKNAIQ